MILLLTNACGDSGNNQYANSPIQGLKLSGSVYKGMTFTGVNIDQSYDVSKLYFYDFSTGLVNTIHNAGDRDPIVFANETNIFHFSRQTDFQFFRFFSKSSGNNFELKYEVEINNIQPGDPWDFEQTSATQAVLAGLNSGLQTIDLSTGKIENAFPENSFTTSNSFSALYKKGSDLFAVTNGLNNGEADNSESLYHMTVGLDGTLTPGSQDASTGVINGTSFTGSNVTTFVETTDNKPYLLSLCNASLQNCKSAAYKLDPDTEKLTLASDFANFEGSFHYQIVGGANSFAYAHIQLGDEYKIAKIDLANGEVIKVIHDLKGNPRPVALMYDKSTSRLFVGDMNELKGLMYVFQKDILLDSFELDTVPFNGELF